MCALANSTEQYHWFFNTIEFIQYSRIMVSTGYEPTTNNTLLAAVTNVVGDMDVDLPYGGGTGSAGGLAVMAPTTPLTPHPSNQSCHLPQ